MKINLIVPNYMPDNLAGTNRMKVFMKKLSRKHQVNLITLRKSSHIKEIKKLLEDLNVNLFVIENNNFHKNNFIKRALIEIAFSKKLYNLSKTIPADIIIATSPSMFIIPILSFENRKKIIDIRDMVWEYISIPVIKNVLSFFILKSLKKYDEIIVTNEHEKTMLSDFNPILISNGIEKAKFEKLSGLSISQEKETVTYIGNIGIAQNVMTLVEAAKQLPDIEFKIVGDGAEFYKIKNYVQKNNLTNVKLYGKLNWEEVLEIYKKSTILWAQLMDDFHLAMPSKLYEYLSTGLPVVYGGSGQAKSFLEKLENCFVYKSGDVDELVKILHSLKNKFFSKSLKNIEFIKNNYIREYEAEKLLKVIESL